MDNQGWIKIHRKLLDTSFAKKPTIGWLFVCLLLKANHKENKFLFNNEEITIKAGQLLTGTLELSKNTGLSVMQVRYGLNALKVTNTLTIKTTNKFSIITINNWYQYQDFNKQSNKPVTNKQQTNNKQITTNNNDKNVKNDNNDNKHTNKPELQMSYLLTIPETHIQEFINDLHLTRQQILDKGRELSNYCQYKRKSYANYKLFLWNALKRDYSVGLKKHKYEKII